MNNTESCSLSLAVSVGYACTLTNWRRCQTNFAWRTGWKNDGGAADGSTANFIVHTEMFHYVMLPELELSSEAE